MLSMELSLAPPYQALRGLVRTWPGGGHTPDLRSSGATDLPKTHSALTLLVPQVETGNPVESTSKRVLRLPLGVCAKGCWTTESGP